MGTPNAPLRGRGARIVARPETGVPRTPRGRFVGTPVDDRHSSGLAPPRAHYGPPLCPTGGLRAYTERIVSRTPVRGVRSSVIPDAEAYVPSCRSASGSNIGDCVNRGGLIPSSGAARWPRLRSPQVQGASGTDRPRHRRSPRLQLRPERTRRGRPPAGRFGLGVAVGPARLAARGGTPRVTETGDKAPVECSRAFTTGC